MSENYPEISVIIPVFNGEKTIRKSINSVLQQRYPNLKLVIVNDGSTDSTARICESYAHENKNILIISKANAGLAEARITGIQSLPHDGLSVFLDADDYLMDDALMVLYRLYKETDADVSCGTVCKVFGHFVKRIQVPALFEKRQVYDKEQIINTIMPTFFGISGFLWSMFAKLIKNEFAKKALLYDRPVHFFGEDIALNMQILKHINSIAVMPDPVCYYTQSGGTSRWMPTFLNDSVSLLDYKINYINDLHLPLYLIRTTYVELKNEFFTYLQMFIRKNGDRGEQFVINEIERCCNIPEIKRAVNVSAGDKSGVAGFVNSLLLHDYNETYRILVEYCNKQRIKDRVRRLITII